jgi:hypothetical protein
VRIFTLLRILWRGLNVVRRPLAARRWQRRLALEMERRPQDVVNVFDRDGLLLDQGVRMAVDSEHAGFGIPFAWFKRAASVREITGREINGPLFYFGKSGWLLTPVKLGSRNRLWTQR